MTLLQGLYGTYAHAFSDEQLIRMLDRGISSEHSLDPVTNSRLRAQRAGVRQSSSSSSSFGDYDSNSSSSSSSMSANSHLLGEVPSPLPGPDAPPAHTLPVAPNAGQLLQTAFQNDDPDLLEEAVFPHMEINPVNAGGANPLLIQAVNHGPNVMRRLLEFGARDPHGTALNAAKRRLKAAPNDAGLQEMVRLLQAHAQSSAKM